MSDTHSNLEPEAQPTPPSPATAGGKWLWTLLAVSAVLAAVTGVVDEYGADYGAKALKRSLVTFAAARTLNGVISVAQGTEVAVEPGGVGVNFTVGQVLDPVNDLVERFSSVMLVATASLGLQNLLLDITSWWALTALLAATAIIVLGVAWWPGAKQGRGRRWLLNIFLGLVLVRFAVPLLMIGSGLVFDTFLAAEQAAASQALEATREEIEALNTEPPVVADPGEGILDRLGAMLDDSLGNMNVRQRLENFKDRLSNASEHIVNLIVIFVLETIVVPLLFLWLLVEFTKKVAGGLTRLT